MKIDSIYIESFGKFKNYKLDFKDGMNIIYGDNEAGKSTIMAFIEMMFYGRTAQEKSTDVDTKMQKISDRRQKNGQKSEAKRS